MSWRRLAAVAWHGAVRTRRAAAPGGAPPILDAAVLAPSSDLSMSHPHHRRVSLVWLAGPTSATFSRGYMSRMRRRIPPRRPPEYDEDDETEKKEEPDRERSIQNLDDDDGGRSEDRKVEEANGNNSGRGGAEEEDKPF